MKNQILEFMEQVDFRPKKAQDLAAEMNIKDEDLETFLAALRELEENGQLIMNKKGRYGLCRHMNLIAGHLEGNPKGFAFFIPDIKERSDVYIAFDNLNGAMHKDRVIIRVIKSHQYVNGREEGEVVRILHHANERVVGIYEESNGGFGFVRPDEKRIGLDIFIPKEDDLKAKEGDVVVANIVKWPKGKRNPQGKITEIIGSKNEKGTDMLT
ncbi:MAG: ribonuclease R, partial [Clostridiales bacterium]